MTKLVSNFRIGVASPSPQLKNKFRNNLIIMRQTDSPPSPPSPHMSNPQRHLSVAPPDNRRLVGGWVGGEGNRGRRRGLTTCHAHTHVHLHTCPHIYLPFRRTHYPATCLFTCLAAWLPAFLQDSFSFNYVLLWVLAPVACLPILSH